MKQFTNVPNACQVHNIPQLLLPYKIGPPCTCAFIRNVRTKLWHGLLLEKRRTNFTERCALTIGKCAKCDAPPLCCGSKFHLSNQEKYKKNTNYFEVHTYY